MRWLWPCLLALLLAPVVLVDADQIGVTRDQGPYDLVKANWMAANYLQALINPRWDAVAFAQERFGASDGRGGLYFIDDQGRVIVSFAEEAEVGPVARVEAVATLARGLLKARIPKSAGRYFFVLDGRQSLYLKPTGEALGAFWLQDYSSPFAQLAAAARQGADWLPFSFPAVERQPEVDEAETRYTFQTAAGQATARSVSSVYDQPPTFEFSANEAGEGARLRLEVKPTGTYHFFHRGHDRQPVPQGETALPTTGGWLLLEHETQLATSDKTGWEDPRAWDSQNSMLLVTYKPEPTLLRLEGDGKQATRLVLEWDTSQAQVSLAPFLELDPADCEYVFDAAESVARSGHFGLAPYFPVRTSNGFYGAVEGLAGAAWLLSEYRHPDAEEIRQAALEAFGAAVSSYERGYRGERSYALLIAAHYLRRIAPEAFDYVRLAREWGQRELGRTPPGWLTPPWSDTALRAVKALRYTWQITGDEVFRQRHLEALGQFALPAQAPYEGFLWRGEAHPFNGYDCTAAAMLIGEWGREGDPRAKQLVEQSGPRYMCDLGFIPYTTWTCDDLLPYYVGYSLPAAMQAPLPEPRHVLRLPDYAAYDETGKVWAVERPAIPFPL